MIVFPIFLFPPIPFFQKLILHREHHLFFEKEENFIKQTFRNRYQILGPNGVQNLIVPIKHDGNRKMKDIKISYAERWQRQHWMSLEAAYRRSAYFEYYEDELKPIVFYSPEYLIDYSFKSLEWCLNKIKLQIRYSFSSSFLTTEFYKFDFRNKFPSNITEHPPYTKNYLQVFCNRFSFIPNLSIIDLLFNQGPKSMELLQTCNNWHSNCN